MQDGGEGGGVIGGGGVEAGDGDGRGKGGEECYGGGRGEEVQLVVG